MAYQPDSEESAESAGHTCTLPAKEAEGLKVGDTLTVTEIAEDGSAMLEGPAPQSPGQKTTLQAFDEEMKG